MCRPGIDFVIPEGGFYPEMSNQRECAGWEGRRQLGSLDSFESTPHRKPYEAQPVYRDAAWMLYFFLAPVGGGFVERFPT